MARGRTLLKLLDVLRSELRLSLNPAQNVQVREIQVNTLQAVQERLYEDFTWPHMRIERSVALQAGQYIYDVPSGMNIDKIEKVEAFLDGGWVPLIFGITGAEYSAHNTDLDERSWPPRRWRISENEDVEVWPIPDTNADEDTREGYLRFTGIRNLNPLVNDEHTADLDDKLIAAYAAVELLSDENQIKIKLNKADQMYQRMRANLSPTKAFPMLGVGSRLVPRRMFVTQYRPPE